MASPSTSRMRLPLSVTKPSRRRGSPPISRSLRATSGTAIGITSTGSGNAPSTSTCFVASTMHTKRREAAAQIFSRVSAPPPPLIRQRCGSNSSAPST